MPQLPDLAGAGVIGAALAGGVAWLRERWRARQPAAIEQANLAVVARARDELAEDNARLRAELAEERAHHALARREWRDEKTAMGIEIDVLEEKVRSMLAEIYQLRSRHGFVDAASRDPAAGDDGSA